MKNNHENLLINESHPFWVELENYKERIFHYRSKKSFNSLTQHLDNNIIQLNESLKDLFFIDKDLFNRIYERNLSFVDDQIKKEENVLTNEIFSRKIGRILKKYRPKIENVLSEIVNNNVNPEFKDSSGLKALQKAMLYDYYFTNPNPEVKQWMSYNVNRNLILSLLFDVQCKTLANSFSKFRGEAAEKISPKTIQILKEKKIFFNS